ncbi:ferredoxin [Actinomadura miaoliensis]|uniref:Ferredoxin n=1 Tax=Actinomadura miaoliensis TaxID=430685 RepID=A0ABP7WSJ0_9ACTN
MRVTVDATACAGAGQCVLAAAEVFDQREEDGTVVLLQAEPPVWVHEAVRQAAVLCPTRAVRVDE